MSRTWKTLIPGVASLAVACAASAILVSRVSSEPNVIAQQSPSQTSTIAGARNLSLQPEAARVNRRLGNVFKAAGGAESILSGTLTVGTRIQAVTMVRRQLKDGEAVDIVLADRRLTWTGTEGAIATATESERLMLERLVFDSPDEFVLAQLRGASYYTITRNLRPDDAGENYSGPLWTLVRVSEPQPHDKMAQASRWRVYYINETTELIDRIVSEQDGQTIDASIQWTERNGRLYPAHYKWTTNGQTLMEFEVAGFSIQK